MVAAALLLSALVGSVAATPAATRRQSGNYHTIPLAKRGIHPRDLDLDSRLSWLREQAEFMEDRYKAEGLPEPSEPLAKRAASPFLDVEPYDVAADRRRRREKRAEATVSLLDNYSQSGTLISDTAYLAQTGIGTPAREFELQVDTGSSNLWVAGPGSLGATRNTFNPTSSSTWKQLSAQTVSLTYGSGSVQGIAGTDSITLGPVSMTGQAVIVGQTLSSGFQRNLLDGILGMAFSSLSVTGQSTLFENLVSSGKLTSPAFGLYLTRASDNATVMNNPLPQSTTTTAQALTGGGEMILGGFDSSLIQGDVAYAPLLARSYWLVQMDGVFVSGKQVSGSTIPAAIDSGTTLSLLPTAVAQGVATALGGQMTTLPGTENLQSTFLVVPCSIDTFEIAFGFAGNQYALNITDLFMGVLDSSGTRCVLGILGRNVPQSATQRNSFIAVIGDSFLKVVYSVYSLSGSGSVGFGALAGTTVRAGNNTSSGGSTTPITVSSAVAGGPTMAPTKSGASVLTGSACAMALTVVCLALVTMG